MVKNQNPFKGAGWIVIGILLVLALTIVGLKFAKKSDNKPSPPISYEYRNRSRREYVPDNCYLMDATHNRCIR